MFLRHRGTLTLVVLLALTLVTSGAGYWVLYAPVNPELASREQLLRGLVLQDLRQLPLERQQAWVDRLQQELSGEFAPPSGAAGMLSDARRAQLAANIAALEEVWFRTRTEQYVSVPPQERSAFLEQQIRLIASLTKIMALTRSDSAAAPAEDAGSAFFGKIDGWVRTAEGPERERMLVAIKDGTVCWLSISDLADFPLGVRRTLAERIARELDRGTGSAAVSGAAQGPTERVAMLRHNAELLVQAYIQTLAQQYAGLPGEERGRFIDEQLAAVSRWGVADLLASGSGPSSRASSLLALARQSEQWVESAPEEDRPQVAAFVAAVQQRLLWSQLPGWMRRTDRQTAAPYASSSS